MNPGDANALLEIATTESKKELEYTNERINFLSGIATNFPTIQKFPERWAECDAAIKVIALQICRSIDHNNRSGHYEHIVVERKKGTAKYEWYLITKVEQTKRKIVLPETVFCIPFTHSPENELFLRFLAYNNLVQYFIVDYAIEHMIKHDFQPRQ